MINVDFTNETTEEVEYIEELKKLINYASKHMKVNNIEFGVIFVDNEKIHELNRDYRSIDRETDVITFRLEDYEKVMCGNINILGDIYISLDKAKSQALEYGHSYLREIAFLLIHGFLHLLGYDHINEKDEKEMFKLQEEILSEYGIKREKEEL